MQDNHTMNCSEVRKRLKPFLEDLLSEEERCAFINHLDSCSRCKEYVGAIGSLSNQLWKLGDVKIPSDFSPTVLFKLKQAEQEVKKPKFVISKKVVVRSLILTLAITVLFFGIYYLKDRIQRIRDTPKVTTEVIRKQKSPSDSEAKALLEELETIATALRPSIKEEIPKEDSEEITPAGEILQDASGDSSRDKTVIPEPRPLHWHFRYFEETKKKRLLEALSVLDIRMTDQASGLLVFTAKGEKVDNILEQILFISQGSSFFQDFTSGVPTYPDREYRVSIYLEGKETAALHWHISSILPHQKSKLFDIIQKSGGSINYESGELIILSIPRTEVENLNMQIRAMRVILSEFGNLEIKETQLVSKPVKISIYFSKR